MPPGHTRSFSFAEIILGIESSCDDTSAAVLRDGVLLSNVIASQQVHKDYGGVVPELASRAHEQNIVPVVSQALAKHLTEEELMEYFDSKITAYRARMLQEASYDEGFKASQPKKSSRYNLLSPDGLGVEGSPAFLGDGIAFEAGVFPESVGEVADKQVVHIREVQAVVANVLVLL